MHQPIRGIIVVAFAGLLAGCTPSPDVNVNTGASPTPTMENAAVTPQPTAPPVVRAASVEFLGLRGKAISGQPLEVTWQVRPGNANDMATHTAVHYDTVSHPGNLGTAVGPDGAGYKQLTPDYASGSYTLPRAFAARLTPQAGDLYLRAHAIVNGEHFWTAEQEIEVEAPPMGPRANPVRPQATPAQPPTPARSPQAAVKTFAVTAKQWTFEPATMTVQKGDRVRLVIKSVDVAHGFALPDFDVDRRLEPGVTETVEFTADKAGTFSFFCNVLCGAGHPAMRGTLIVQ